MKHALPALAAAFFLAVSAPSQASPPEPLPNPDQPAVTPVFRSGGSDASSSSDASASTARICPTLRRLARQGNGAAGLRVLNLKTGKDVCGLNSLARRSLASNNKLFTTSTVLDRLGNRVFRTRVYAAGPVRKGVLKGNLYLKGGGDPSFGTNAFLQSYLAGEGTSVERLATQIRKRGIRQITGRVFGDDTIFDRLRGVADSGYATSPWIGPLSGLSFNAGYTSASLSSFSSNPARPR